MDYINRSALTPLYEQIAKITAGIVDSIDWSAIKNKPFGDETVYKNVTWDGKTEGLLSFTVRKEDNTQNCSKCKNTGYITYWKKIKNGDKEIKCQFMAVCSCGKQKQYKGWECSEERYRTNFYTLLAVELGL